MKLHLDEVRSLATSFSRSGITADPVPFGGGHINDTYLFQTDTQDHNTRYILQRINQKAFPRPNEVMENMVRVTDYLRGQIAARGGDPTRETLEVRRTGDDGFFAVDSNGDYWRSYRFVDNTASYDRTEDINVFCEAGRAFGRFLGMLDGFDAATLHETIENFHNTPQRFVDFRAAVANDRAGRAAEVSALIDEALTYEPFASTLVDALAAGELPLRVTHNDTKLNNVLIDQCTGRGLCVIDLDTVMPGLAAYDFGDAIRFGASTAGEDEADLSKVRLSLPLYHAYAEGFLSEAGGILTQQELASLPMGAKLMTLECAIRFLGDYLNGDVYFKIDHPTHNLLRAQTQLKLLTEIDAHWGELMGVVLTFGKGTERQ